MTRARFVAAALIIGAVLAMLILAEIARPPARTSAARLLASETKIDQTVVPTVEYRASRAASRLLTPIPTTITQPTLSAGASMSVQSAVPLTIPGPLVDPAIRLLQGPVAVPLEIQIPALKINAPVLGVGLTETNAMASPIGLIPDDPIWQTVFWYRGGGIPGDVGTATFAGHFDDALGRPAIFAYLGDLRVGDLIIVQDQRSGLDIPFIVSETKTYTDQEAADPAVLARIFGSSSVSGAESPPVSDQLSHLTLITCAGAWMDGSFNLRLVVYAIRASYPLGLGE